MAKVFRPSNREARILSRIESSKERARRLAIEQAKNVLEPLSNAIAMKLIERKLIQTTSKQDIEEQIAGSLQKLTRADDFDIDYQIAPIRRLVPHPNLVSLYLTVFVVEQLINHRSVEDIYGSDEEIYNCINSQVTKLIL
jgi:VIT1/CCC1 family predicted Fe2+/Mn2+ transporter